MTHDGFDFKRGTVITVSVPRNRMFAGWALFKLHDTHGVPLEMTVGLTMEKRMFIEWGSYFRAAIKAGWSSDTAIKKVISACRDNCYGGDYLRRHFKVKESL